MSQPNADFPSHCSLQEVKGATLFIDPNPGSGERIAMAVALIDALGVVRCWPTLTPKRFRSVFGSEREGLLDAAHFALSSVERHLSNGGTLEQWQSPLVGIYLDSPRNYYAADVDDLRRVALGAVSAFFNADQPGDASDDHSGSGVKEEPVGYVIRTLKPSLERFVNRAAFLGSTPYETRFTFLSPTFAANYVRLAPKSIRQAMTRAKAGLWDLSLLKDAPNMLFKPEVRELIASVAETELADVETRDALRELIREAELRGVPVIQVRSSREAAERIVAQVA